MENSPDLPTAAVNGRRGGFAPSHVRTLVGIIFTVHVYTIAATGSGYSWLAWCVPGLLLIALAGWPAGWAAFYGTFFAFLCGITFADNAAPRYLPLTTVSAIFSEVIKSVSTLLAGAIPSGLFACIYAGRAGGTPAAARSSLAAWIWVSCELLRTLVVPGAPWINLGDSQAASLRVASSAGVAGGVALSFVMVLFSSAVAEALQQYASLSWRPRLVARWAALPAASLATLAILTVTSPTAVEGAARLHTGATDDRG